MITHWNCVFLAQTHRFCLSRVHRGKEVWISMSLSTTVSIHQVCQVPYYWYACQSNYATQQTVLTLNSVSYSYAHINCPQVLKLYAWEEAFQRRLQVIRDQELHYVRKAAIYLSGTAISFSCSTVMVSANTRVIFVVSLNIMMKVFAARQYNAINWGFTHFTHEQFNKLWPGVVHAGFQSSSGPTRHSIIVRILLPKKIWRIEF